MWGHPALAIQLQGNDHRTQFQIKGGRLVRRRDIFDVLGKRYKSFLKHFPTNISIVRNKITKDYEKNYFFGFYTI